MNETLKEVFEKCNKATSPNNVEFDVIENGWGVRYIRIYDVLKIIEKAEDTKEEIKHWFEVEIELAKERMDLKYNPMFNGVEVGHKRQIELNKAHIRYCEYAIKALCNEEGREDGKENR